MQPLCTIGLVSYKRPLFLAECIKAMYRKPGMPFELLIWSNDIGNKGSIALKDIFDKVKTKYFVVVEEDEIWFQDNWLKLLVEAFEQKPGISKQGLKEGFKNEWGILATNTLQDLVNGGTFPYSRIIRLKKGRFMYWTGIYAGGGAMIFKTEGLRKMRWSQKNFNDVLYSLEKDYDINKYPQGRVENIFIYHAYSEYWNALYPKPYYEKQKKKLELVISKPMEMFLTGNFDKYAKQIYKENTSYWSSGVYWKPTKEVIKQEL